MAIFKSPRTDGFTNEFYHRVKQELTMLSISSKKNEEQGTFSNLFCETSNALIPKLDEDTTRKLQSQIPDEYRCKNLQPNTRKQNLTAH